MIGALKRRYESFRGVGESSLAIQALDGAYRPNQLLERAVARASVPAADNLIAIGGSLHFSSGADRWLVGPEGKAVHVRRYGGEITAMASEPGGTVAVAVREHGVLLEGGMADGRHIDVPGGADVTALAFDGSAVVLAVGSMTNSTDNWTRDLMEKGRSGQIVRHQLSSQEPAILGSGLPYPWGVAVEPGGAILVSACWTNQILRISRDGSSAVVVDSLPGYPARIVPASGGGYWLSLVAPRNQLLEFVLREQEYRRRMIAEIEPKQWIAPAYAPPDSFMQPMQQGSQRTLGILKPWAPTLSYGLVALLDKSCKALTSYHSRADGARHGVTSALDLNGELYFTSRGAGEVASVPLNR